jgi:hypothetical protein
MQQHVAGFHLPLIFAFHLNLPGELLLGCDIQGRNPIVAHEEYHIIVLGKSRVVLVKVTEVVHMAIG